MDRLFIPRSIRAAHRGGGVGKSQPHQGRSTKQQAGNSKNRGKWRKVVNTEGGRVGLLVGSKPVGDTLQD